MPTTSLNKHDSHDVLLHTEDSINDVSESELNELISEPLFHEQANSARLVAASYAENSQECRNFMLMLGIFPGQIVE